MLREEEEGCMSHYQFMFFSLVCSVTLEHFIILLPFTRLKGTYVYQLIPRMLTKQNRQSFYCTKLSTSQIYNLVDKQFIAAQIAGIAFQRIVSLVTSIFSIVRKTLLISCDMQPVLTRSKTTNCRPFQTKRVCRRQF